MTAQNQIPAGAALVAQELKNRVEMQERRYRQTIPFSATLEPNGTAGAQKNEKIKLSTEGDFVCTHITVKLLGLDANGAALDPATFGATGVTVALSESGFGRKLFRDNVALECVATPGYGAIMYQPFPFDQVFLAGSDIEFDVRNASNVRQRMIWTFHGYQHRGSYKAAVGLGA